MLKTEHDNIKAEIETREKTCEVVALGEDMVAEEHSALGLLFFLVWSYNIMVCVAMKRMI